MDYIFIDKKSNRDIEEIGLIRDDTLVDYYLEDSGKSTTGNIYRARVLDVIPGINAAFLDIGLGVNAYLAARDALGKSELYSKEKPKINEILKAGEEVIVQVKKEAYGDKGPKVTRHLEFSSRNIVLTPYSNRINISRKIKDRKERVRLEEIGKRIREDGIGMIIRTAAKNIDDKLLESEYKELLEIYNYIESEKNFLPTPKLLFEPITEGERFIRDSLNEEIEYIIVNSKERELRLGQLLESNNLYRKDLIRLDEDFSTKYDLSITKQISEALKRKVILENGASIFIDRTEALTAIDVNTESYVGRNSLGKTVFEVNKKAAIEIARQIRIRNISGIILIDFISMASKKQEDKLIDLFQEELDKDPVKSYILGFTRLGLLEMTREKINNPIEELLMSDCQYCSGRGKVKKNIDIE